MLNKIYAIIIIISTLIIGGLATFIIGCQSAPSREDFPQIECFYSADCFYRNEKNPDKTACSKLSEGCFDACKEKRTYGRLKYCKENTPEGMSENECRLYINQK